MGGLLGLGDGVQPFQGTRKVYGRENNDLRDMQRKISLFTMRKKKLLTRKKGDCFGM